MLLENYDYTKTVMQSNIISQNAYCSPSNELTLKQKRLLAVMISRIEKQDQSFKYETFTFKDYFRFTGLKDPYSGGTKKALEKNITELKDKEFCVIGKNSNDKIKTYKWFSEATISWEKRQITLKLHDDIKEFYLNLPNTYFTVYQLGYTMGFTKKYTYKVYEFTKSFLNLKVTTIKFDKALQIFGSCKYDRYSDLDRRVLEPAIDEINRLSDILVYYKPYKKKNYVTHIFFAIFEKKGKYRENVDAWKTKEIKTESLEKQMYNAFKDEINMDDVLSEEEGIYHNNPSRKSKNKGLNQNNGDKPESFLPDQKLSLDDEEEEDDRDNDQEENIVYDDEIDKWRDLM